MKKVAILLLFVVAYTIMTLSKFYDVLMGENYRLKMETVFDWFLGKQPLTSDYL
jgi:hypothetical protein